MRIAWFTPLSPARSGLAVHTADVLSALRTDFHIDVFVDDGDDAALAGRARPAEVCPAHDFIWRHARRPYDVTVYDVANTASHTYMWGYAVRYPGLSILHDVVLHHSRAAHLLRRNRLDDYRAELRFDGAGNAADVCELARAAIPHLLAEWPLLGPIVAASRRSAVCDAGAADVLRRRYPDARIDILRFGATDLLPETRRPAAPEPLVFGVCAPTAAIRRLDTILDAFARLPPAPATRLRVLHPVVEPEAATSRIDALGLADRVTATPAADPDAAVAASDVCICLSWPPAGETTPLWIRCLAAGKPTIVSARSGPVDAPLVDPRTWRHRNGAPEEGVAVAVDPTAEADTLTLAMRRLAADVELRAALGVRARRYWEQQHGGAAMAEDYRCAIRTAAVTPRPDPDSLPTHLRADGLEHARAISARLGATVDFLDAATAP